MKTCTKCGEAKPLTDFHKDAQKKDGLRPDCKDCFIRRHREWINANRGTTRAQARRWAKENPERAREKTTRWRRANPDKRRQMRHVEYLKNKDAYREALRRWQVANRERTRELALQWARNNPEKIREHDSRRRASKRRQTPPWLTREHKEQMWAIYASARPGEHVDHIWPLRGKDAWGLHVPWNLQVLPAEINLRKSNKPPTEVECPTTKAP